MKHIKANWEASAKTLRRALIDKKVAIKEYAEMEVDEDGRWI